jgi:hypothetical protein
MVTLESIIDICKRKDFEAMPLSFPFKLMAPHILMVATHDAYRKNSDVSLHFYDKKLSGNVGCLKSMYSMVDLGDFLQAYNLAADTDAVNDPVIAKVIYAYVSEHATALAPIMDEEEVPQAFKDEIVKAFPFIQHQ